MAEIDPRWSLDRVLADDLAVHPAIRQVGCLMCTNGFTVNCAKGTAELTVLAGDEVPVIDATGGTSPSNCGIVAVDGICHNGSEIAFVRELIEAGAVAGVTITE